MITNKYKETVEAELFRHFAYDTLVDIFNSGLVSCTQETWNLLVRLVAYYDPALSVYVARCDAWQILLCQQTIPGDWEKLSSLPVGLLEGLKVIERDNHYDWTIRNADPYLVKCVHQLVRMFFKFEGAARSETDFEAVKLRLSRPTVTYDNGLPHDTLNLSSTEVKAMRDITKFLIAPRSWDDLRGRFGPGSSADVKTNHDKFLRAPIPVGAQGLLDMWHLPFNDTLFGGNGANSPRSFFRYGMTKVSEVPKSLKSTRVVSAEPANLMFAQLAIHDELTGLLNGVFPESVTLDNAYQHCRLLWVKGYTSIDLSDASDHVSRRLVSMILPHWKDYLFPVRSTFSKFPDGSICPLRTFAPMGAGFCFSVLTATCLAIARSAARRAVHVYGDDIICHVTDYQSVVDRLTRSGLVVNQMKSCPTGIYRESCGLEIYKTVDISPLLIRKDPAKVDILTLEKWLSRLEQGWVGQSPWVNVRRKLLALWYTNHISDISVRWRRRYQRIEAKVPVYHDQSKDWHLYGEDSLRRWFTLATDDRNERPDSAYSWVGPTRPSLQTWQQSLRGRSEKERQNLAGRIAERRRNNSALQLSWRSVTEFPRFWRLMGPLHINHTTITQEVLNDYLESL